MNVAMAELGAQGAIFIGYNVARGDAMGTLKGIEENQKLETPVAENLMSGLAIGMSFEGFRPVLYFERHDFILVAMDAIVNHRGNLMNSAAAGIIKTLAGSNGGHAGVIAMAAISNEIINPTHDELPLFTVRFHNTITIHCTLNIMSHFVRHNLLDEVFWIVICEVQLEHKLPQTVTTCSSSCATTLELDIAGAFEVLTKELLSDHEAFFDFCEDLLLHVSLHGPTLP
jgi:hypothetical protein